MHDSTHCDKCSESDYNYLELDPTWVSLEHPEEERGRNRGRPGWMYYTCLLVTGFSARRPQHSCKRAEQRDREQLQSSCQPHQSATNGTAYSVGTGTHTPHTHTLRAQACGQEQCTQYFAVVIKNPSSNLLGDFPVTTSAVHKRIAWSSKARGNCTTSGLSKNFQNLFDQLENTWRVKP